MLLILLSLALAETSRARGFNDDIPWLSLEEAKTEAKSTGKPILFLIHKTWCGACKRLKGEFSGSFADQILAEAPHFVMANAEDDEEPQGKEFGPDGGYIPRILFLNSDGQVVPELYNEQGSDSYKYYYPTAAQVVSGMKRAKEYFDQ